MERRLLAGLPEHITTGDASGVFAQHGVPKGEQVTDAGVGDAIVDLLALTARLHKPTPAQAAQMGRDATLRRVERRHQLPDAAFTYGSVEQQGEETQACGVAKHPEEARRQVSRLGAVGRCVMPEWLVRLRQILMPYHADFPHSHQVMLIYHTYTIVCGDMQVSSRQRAPGVPRRLAPPTGEDSSQGNAKMTSLSTAQDTTTRRPKRFALALATARLLYATDPRAFIISSLASLTEPLFYPAFLLLLQRLLTEIAGDNGSVRITSSVELIGAAMLAILLVQRLGIIVRDASSTILRQEAWVAISKRIMAKLPAVPYSLFENNAFQARYGLVIREASMRSITLVDSLLSTAPILVGAVAVALTLFTVAPLLVLILLVIAIPAAFIERRFSNAMYELQEHSAPLQLRLEALTNMQVDATWQRDVRIYQSDLLAREHSQLAHAYLRELKGVTARFLGLRSSAALVQVAGLGLAMVAAFALIARGQITLVSLAVLIPGIPLLSGMINAFIYSLRSLFESLRYADTLFEFLNTERIDGVALTPPAPALRRERLAAIRLDRVSYIYPQTQARALDDVSSVFRPGLTAIVGTNGAGKSTLVKLVTGLIAPTAGALYAQDAAGKQIPLETCAKAVLFQDPGHFPFSIRHNVTMQFDGEGKTDEDARVAAAVRDAGLEEAVAALPDDIETIVGAGFGGVADLSGGQWQRLALARLLAHDAPLLLLDEPSASLDPLGERQIFALLSTLAREQEKIILFTTHRYDTIRRADTIVVLVDGRIAEVGTPEELERKAGAFWSLYFGAEAQRVQ